MKILKLLRSEFIEGEVENFIPMPYTGHMNEEFDVNGIHFEYSDYGSTIGYNNTSSHGGVIKEGLLVKIGYIQRQEINEIIYLEIKSK